MKGFLFCIVFFLPSLVFAQSTGTWLDGPVAAKDTIYGVSVNGNSFTALDIHSGVTTDAMKLKGFRYLEFHVSYTWAAATDVTLTCQDSENGTTWFDVHAQQMTVLPTVNTAPLKLDYAVAASHNWSWPVPTIAVYLRCTITAVGGNSGDVATVTARGGF